MRYLATFLIAGLLILAGCGGTIGDEPEVIPAEQPTAETEQEASTADQAPATPDDSPGNEQGEDVDTKPEPTHSDHRDSELASADSLAVHFIDVGQGDSILIEARPGLVVLIDGGPRTAGQVVVDYLTQRGIRVIDIVIGTHPHADHIGGLIDVLTHLKVHRVIDAGIPHTTRTFDDYLTAIETQVAAGDCTYETPQGQVIALADNITLTILGPDRDLGSLNDNSVVCRVDFGATSFLFTGDAEQTAEADLLQRGASLGADVLKVGHHGSRTSTTQAFLTAVAPTYAVIQVGADNQYGHPHGETLERLTGAGVIIFRNDLHGTIVFESDGTEVTSNVQSDPASTVARPTGGVNINTASLEDLQAIIHIGEARAREIIDQRPFNSIDDLLQITGIGPARLQDIKDEGKAYVD